MFRRVLSCMLFVTIAGTYVGYAYTRIKSLEATVIQQQTEVDSKIVELEAALLSAEEDRSVLENDLQLLMNTVVTNPVGFTADEIMMLAELIYYEANVEPYEGQVAAARSIINRVLLPQWPSTLEGVIFQKGRGTAATADQYQFCPLNEGKWGTVKPTLQNVRAVIDALNNTGNMPLGVDSFRMGEYFSGGWYTNYKKIGNHYFSFGGGKNNYLNHNYIP